jgi:hypothetical protein
VDHISKFYIFVEIFYGVDGKEKLMMMWSNGSDRKFLDYSLINRESHKSNLHLIHAVSSHKSVQLGTENHKKVE